jgi:ATP-dependent DNA helicase RecG
VEFDGSIERKEIPEIPVKAIREVLVNSYCHKDYVIPQTNEIAVFKDRIEIYNSGAFPDGLTPNDYIKGNPRPYKRNPLLAQLLYYPRDIESFGTGFKRIKEECDKIGTKFDFELHKYGFVFIFRRKSADGRIKTKQEKADRSAERSTPILAFLVNNEFVTNKIVRGILQTSDATAKRTLKEMTEKGLLVAAGEGRGRKYSLADHS